LTAETCRLARDTLTPEQVGQCVAGELAAIRTGLTATASIFLIGAAFFWLAMSTVDHDLAKLREA
ncbi:MAG: hypothetical protein AAFY82_07735, partial [Pseudomonadota bacterium]